MAKLKKADGVDEMIADVAYWGIGVPIMVAVAIPTVIMASPWLIYEYGPKFVNDLKFRWSNHTLKLDIGT